LLALELDVIVVPVLPDVMFPFESVTWVMSVSKVE